MDDGQFEDTAESKGKVRLSKRDLFADSVQTLLAEGCRVTGLRLNWADKICFTLKHDFSITAMRFLDEIKDLAKDNYTETKEERFATDFFIMAQTLGEFLDELLPIFTLKESSEETLEAELVE